MQPVDPHSLCESPIESHRRTSWALVIYQRDGGMAFSKGHGVKFLGLAPDLSNDRLPIWKREGHSHDE
jgi:hypothetical protein